VPRSIRTCPQISNSLCLRTCMGSAKERRDLGGLSASWKLSRKFFLSTRLGVLRDFRNQTGGRSGGEKRGPACHRSPSAKPRTVETVKTCAVLTPSLGQSLDPRRTRVQEPSNPNLRKLRRNLSIFAQLKIRTWDVRSIYTESSLCANPRFLMQT